MKQTAVNKAKGARFEAILQWRAMTLGMKALKNELTFKYLKGGKVQPIHADLDFRILRRDGRVCYVDCKSWQGDRFTWSQLDMQQYARACQYEDFNIPAGFVVHFSGTDAVCFYSATLLKQHGPGSRFTAAQGVLLGQVTDFDLEPIFRSRGGLTPPL